MDVELTDSDADISNNVSKDVPLGMSKDIFADNGIVVHGDLISPRFVIDTVTYDEPQLYNMLAALDTEYAACLLLRIIEHLSALRRNYADAHEELREQLLSLVYSSYVRYDCYCRSVIDDVDIVEEMSAMTL